MLHVSSMRTSKVSPCSASGCYPWIVAFSISLMLLIALSRSLLHDQISPPPEKTYRIPVMSKDQGDPPVLAYWIHGTGGDCKRMLRLLKAIYHPRNQYLLQLDADASDHERAELVLSVQSEPVFRAFSNVDVVGKSYAVNQMGASALSAMLHAAALLLRVNADWDWFINLSPSDYPLVSQDDLLHAISPLPRDLNFIDFASMIAFKGIHNINQVVVDPSLYLQKRSHLFYAVERRKKPNAFKIFGGSPWLILTRDFLEYCVQGWENLPRKLLMYFSNTARPLDFYFHTVLCNSPQFQNKTVNRNLRYSILEIPANDESGYEKMITSGSAFARPFIEDDLILDKIDKNVLNLLPNGIVTGQWCLGHDLNDSNINRTESSEPVQDLCSEWGNINVVKPGSNGLKPNFMLSNFDIEERLRTNQCHL